MKFDPKPADRVHPSNLDAGASIIIAAVIAGVMTASIVTASALNHGYSGPYDRGQTIDYASGTEFRLAAEHRAWTLEHEADR